MRTAATVAALFVVAAPVAASTVTPQDDRARTIEETFEVGGLEGVYLDVSVGEVEIEGADVDEVRVEVRIECHSSHSRGCRERAADVELRGRQRRGRLQLELEGMSTWSARNMNVEVDVVVPEEMAFELDMGVGEVTIENLRGDLIVDMGIGEITVTMPEEVIGSMTLDNGVGETRLERRDRGDQNISGILGGREIHWEDGPGTRRVKIELNVGELHVRLT